jgi:hypothetical protein
MQSMSDHPQFASERVLRLERANPRPVGAVNLDAMIPYRPGAYTLFDNPEIFWALDFAQLADEKFAAMLTKWLYRERRTWHWAPDEIARYIGRLTRGDAKYPVVLHHTDPQLIRVQHGKHRLSAILAWIRNDYGDGDYSKVFTGERIAPADAAAAKACRAAVRESAGIFNRRALPRGRIPVNWVLHHHSPHWDVAEIGQWGQAIYSAAKTKARSVS